MLLQFNRWNKAAADRTNRSLEFIDFILLSADSDLEVVQFFLQVCHFGLEFSALALASVQLFLKPLFEFLQVDKI